MHAPIQRLGFLFAALVLQALTLIGILSSVAACVRSLPKLAILTNFVIAALHYVSVVYFPIDILPVYVRPLLYLNPLTYAINFSRGLLLQGEADYVPLGILIGWCCVWSLLGYLGLRRRVQRLR